MRIKVRTTALASLLGLLLLAVTSASAAAVPTLGRCLASGSGRFANTTCSKTKALGGYEFSAGLAKTRFTLTGAATRLEVSKATRLECKSLTGSGQLGSTQLQGLALTLTGCHAGATSCASAGAGAGEVRSEALEAGLGYEDAARGRFALDLYAAAHGGPLLSLSCGGAVWIVRGSAIVALKATKMAASAKLAFKESKGHQKPEHLEGQPDDVLEVSVGGGAYADGGLKATWTLAAEEPFEVSDQQAGGAGGCEGLAELTPPSEVNGSGYKEMSGATSAIGRWSVLEGVEHARTVHAVLLQNGKLLLMAGSGNSRMEFKKGCFRTYVYDPTKNTWKEILTPKDLFCSGHVELANGNILIIGGTRGYPPEPKEGEFPSTIYLGENTSWIFNIRSEKYEEVRFNPESKYHESEPGPLLNGAWYPSATELGNGNVISFGGLNEEGKGATQTNYFIDESNTSPYGEADPPGEWVGFGTNYLQQTFDWFWGLYPSMILTADGRLFYDGSHVFGDGLNDFEESGKGEANAPEGSSLYAYWCSASQSQNEKEQFETNPNAEVENPETKVRYKRVTSTPGLTHGDERDQSASLLLPPAQSQRVMIMGGGNTYKTEQDATDSTQEINLLEASPKWKAGPNLPAGELDNGEMEMGEQGKMYVSAVALPDGTVLETGGSRKPRTEDVHEASIFNPETNRFTSVAADPVGRDYHSSALLLPDGRVMTFGSNPINHPSGEGFETRISIYEPPYLFKGERPVLTAIDGEANSLEGDVTKTKQWEYASAHKLSFTSASEVKSAVLIRPAAVTHSSDPNQREVALPITARKSGQLEVELTANPNIAPPGYYMVFIVNAAGVPSVAQWVHVGPQGAP